MILKYKCVAVHRGADWSLFDFEAENDGKVEPWGKDTPRSKMVVPVTNPKFFDHFAEGTVYGVNIAALEVETPPETVEELTVKKVTKVR